MPPDRDPELVHSKLSALVTEGRVRLRVDIYRLESYSDWILEVIDPSGASTVWEDPFPSEEAAFAEFERTLREEGTGAFTDPDDVVPFPPRR